MNFKKISGIYKISNTLDNRIYVGQSIDILGRFYSHKKSLFLNSHRNPKLQNFVNKYGIDKLIFEIIYIEEKNKLNEMEKFYIKFYDSFNNGFNCTIGGDTALYRKNVNGIKKIIDPSGNEHIFETSIKEFCRNHNLDSCSVSEVLRGKAESYKGWKREDSILNKEKLLKNSIILKNYKTGQKEIINSFADFARKYKFHRGNVYEVARGRKNTLHSWYNPEYWNPRNIRIRNLNNITFDFFFENLSTFCKQHNLHVSCMRNLIKGNIISYKGWILDII